MKAPKLIANCEESSAYDGIRESRQSELFLPAEFALQKNALRNTGTFYNLYDELVLQ